MARAGGDACDERGAEPSDMNRSPRGVALISILLVVALLSTLTFQIYSHQTMVTAQTRVALEASRMRHAVLASELMARQLLTADWLDEETRERDDAFEPWGQEQPILTTEAGTLQYHIFDLNSRLNINALASSENQKAAEIFAELLRDVGASQELAPIWRDWVDGDDSRSVAGGFQGKEELEWLGASPPFRTPNQLAGDLSEARMLVQLEPQVYGQLTQFVSVLPTTELKLNVNTAPSEVLNALIPLGTGKLSGRVGRRNFGSVDAFTELHRDFAEVSDQLSVRSKYFEVRATLFGASSRMDVTSHLYRDGATGEVSVYARTFATRHIWSS